MKRAFVALLATHLQEADASSKKLHAILGLSEDEGTLLQSNMPLSQMIIHTIGSLLDLMVQQWGGVMPTLLPAWHAVPGTELQVA